MDIPYMKDKKRILGKKKVFFGVLLITALIYFLCYTETHRETIFSAELYTLSYVPDNSSDVREVWLENDVEYKSIVEFEQYGRLTGASVRIKEVPTGFTGELIFRIYDKDGTEIGSSCISNADLLANTTDYVGVWNMDVPVDAGERIWTSWTMTGDNGGGICLYSYENENGEVILNGDKTEESLQQNCYIHISYRWTVILAILISVGALSLIFFDGVLAKWIRWGVTALIPLIILFLWLEANNNFEFFQGENILSELIGLYLLLGLAICVLGLRGGAIFYLGVGLIVTLVNYYMQLFRAQPLLITDLFSLYTALHVADNYSYTITYPMLSVVMIYAAVLMLMATYSCPTRCMTDGEWKDEGSEEINKAQRGRRQNELWKGRKHIKEKILLRFGGCILCLVSYVWLTKNVNFYISSWNMKGTIAEHGWLMTNTELAKICINNKPEEYDKDQTIEFITGVGEKIADDAAVIMPENLIVIMDESFSDLSVLGNIETDDEIIPFFNSLKDKNRVEMGYLGVHVLGGGTVSTEWEFLTGGNTGLMNLGSIYPYTLLQNKTKQFNYEGICSSLADIGYQTVAMHPDLATNYGRQSVYPLLSFQKFYNINNYYVGADHVRYYVSEESDFDEIIAQYENKESDNLFVFNVTIQNHGGYSDPLDEYDVTASNIDCDELDVYLTLIHKTDQALKSLIEYFSEVDEPTMIVFFGDHQPSLPDDFYNDIYGTSERSDEQEEKRYVTPYLIWSNYDRMTYDESYINAGYLEAIVKSEIGLELNQWDRYLLGIMEEYPVVGQYGLFDDDYTFTSYSNLNEKQSEDLKQMQHAMYYWWTHH